MIVPKMAPRVLQHQPGAHEPAREDLQSGELRTDKAKRISAKEEEDPVYCRRGRIQECTSEDRLLDCSGSEGVGEV